MDFQAIQDILLFIVGYFFITLLTIDLIVKYI